MLDYANLFLVLMAVAAGFVAVFSAFVLRAYRMTGQPWLLSFCLGFALLEVSFLFVLLNRQFGENRVLYNGTLWVHQVIQTAGFGLIAATYFLKDRNVSARRLGIFAAVYLAVLASALLVYFVAPARTGFVIRSGTDEYLYGLGLALVAYALSKAARGFASGRRKAVLVSAGFAALAGGQVSWVYWGVTDAALALLLAGSFLPLGLALLTTTTLAIWRER